jgi:hypothetical protein
MKGEAPAAYEEKLVPSSGRGPSITRSSAFCQDARCPIPPHPLRQFYHRPDKVVTLLDKI